MSSFARAMRKRQERELAGKVLEVRVTVNPALKEKTTIPAGFELACESPNRKLRVYQAVDIKPRAWWKVAAFFRKTWRPTIKVKGYLV